MGIQNLFEQTGKARRGVVVLALAMLSLTGCSKEEGATPIVGRDARAGGPTGTTVSTSGLSLNGWVIAQSSQQSVFREGLVGLLDANLPESYVGYVSAEAQGGTGIFLAGRVDLQTGVLNAANTNSAHMNIRTDSRLLIMVYDEFTGRPDASGVNVGPIPIYLTRATGYVQGNRAFLTFSDSHGSIVMDGTFNGQTFEGVMTYDNTRTVSSGASPAAGELGWFQVPTCQFFRCN